MSVVAGAAVALVWLLASILRRVLLRLGRERSALAISVAALERSNRDLDAFAGSVAHDLRNALSPVVMGTRLIQSRRPSDPQIAIACDRVDRGAHRAIRLVDTLLAFARAEQQSDPMAAAPVRGVIEDVLEELEPEITRADATLETALDDVAVRCPAGLLHVLLANVIGNAVKFVRGRDPRRVTIKARAVERSCEILVEDTGPGIPEGARARIFDPFFRVPGTATPGTGIGLATVRRILDAQGGRIHVTSGDGGSSFLITLPFAERSEVSIAELERRPPPASGNARTELPIPTSPRGRSWSVRR